MGIIVGVNLYEADGKEYIELDVPAYPIGISCKGVYYYRSGSTRQILTGPALEAFLMRKRGATWDNLPLPAFSINDVDDVIVERFKKWAAKKGRIDKSVLDEPKDVLMEKLHLINGSYLTNAAMLLFSKEPEKFPALTIPILPMCSIWQASSKAGGVELKKFAQFVKKTVCRSLFIQSTPAIL